MASSLLIEVLNSIRCPHLEKLKPESIDWIFDNANTQSFLSWFCSSIKETNVISTKDLRDYQSLEKRGDVIENTEIENAFSLIPDAKSFTEEQLQIFVEEMKTQVIQLKTKKNALMKHCNWMSVHHIDLNNRVSKMLHVEAHWTKEKIRAEEKCRSDNTKLGEIMEDLSKSVSNLMKLYSPCEDGKSRTLNQADNDRNFLSQVDLNNFHEAEAKFSKELTGFTKKQFFVGMADMAGEHEETQYNLLDVSSSCGEHVTVDNQTQNSFFDDCQEFARLQRIFPRSESSQINALISAKKASSAVHEAKSILHQVKSDVFPKVPNDISRLRHVAEQNAGEAKAESTPLLSSIPDLIQELGGLQGTEILTGDYNLKVKRQDYFMKSQDKIIKHLVCQRARSEFLSMLYDLELKWHKETHGLLLAARTGLETLMLEWQTRMTEFDEPDLSEKKFHRNVVDTRDTATARLYRLIEGGKEDGKQIYLPVQKVIAKAGELKSQEISALSSDSSRDEYNLDKVNQLTSCVAECESVLYDGSSTWGGQPNLTQAQIQSVMTHVAGQLASLESKVMEVVAQVNSKKTDLRNNILQKKERELYVLFHTNPEKLKYVVNGLAERGKARDIKEQ